MQRQLKHKKRISCTGKVKHKDMQSAKRASCVLFQSKGLVSYYYKCDRCGFWHVGKPSYYDDHEKFWRNIYRQMNQHDKDVLTEGA